MRLNLGVLSAVVWGFWVLWFEVQEGECHIGMVSLQCKKCKGVKINKLKIKVRQ